MILKELDLYTKSKELFDTLNSSNNIYKILEDINIAEAIHDYAYLPDTWGDDIYSAYVYTMNYTAAALANDNTTFSTKDIYKIMHNDDISMKYTISVIDKINSDTKEESLNCPRDLVLFIDIDTSTKSIIIRGKGYEQIKVYITDILFEKILRVAYQIRIYDVGTVPNDISNHLLGIDYNILNCMVDAIQLSILRDESDCNYLSCQRSVTFIVTIAYLSYITSTSDAIIKHKLHGREARITGSLNSKYEFCIEANHADDKCIIYASLRNKKLRYKKDLVLGAIVVNGKTNNVIESIWEQADIFYHHYHRMKTITDECLKDLYL